MKRTRTLFAAIPALLLLFVLTLPVKAAANPGSIHIANARAEETYSLYRIFNLQSYDPAAGSYLYTVNSDWSLFIAQPAIEDIYIEWDRSGYVSWVDDADAAEFAQLALAYAKANSIVPVASAVISVGEDGAITVSPDTNVSVSAGSSGKYTLSFTSLPLGYYLLDSTAGVLCSLNTTAPSVTLYEKNTGLPYIEKVVREDSTNTFEDYNTADIGQTMEFQITISANTGARNFVLRDTMSSGLTFSGADTLSVRWTDDTGTEYSIQPAEGTDYTINTDTLDEYTFELIFAQAFCDNLKNYDRLVVTYTGYLNGGAVIGGAGNGNTATLVCDAGTTRTDSTYTYTGEVHIYKHNDSGAPLADAQFKLSNINGEWYRLDETTGHVNWVGNQSQGTAMSSGPDGMLVFSGLDAGEHYKLVETQAPAGYKLCAPTSFSHTITVDPTGTAILSQSAEAPIYIENESGAKLPETGSIGTAPFYYSGLALILAGLLLMRKQKVFVKS